MNIDGHLLYNRGVNAFRDYAPVSYKSTDGFYRRFRWGRNLALFCLDERSFLQRHLEISAALTGE